MNKNKLKILITVLIIIFCCILCILFICNKHQKDSMDTEVNNKIESLINEQTKNSVKNNQNAEKQVYNKKDKEIIADNNEFQKDTITNLFNDIPSSLPLSAITEIVKLPANIQNMIVKIAETNNIYMLKRRSNKIFLITDNSDNIRQNIDFVEISLNNGHQVNTTLGYNDKIKDSDNDIWEYNEETKLPTRHSKYNKDGDLDFVETWNYEEDNPIKYEMKDANGNVISMRKETLHNGTDLRIEHLLYNEQGNTIINISTTYEGQDIKRFTYYNADDIKDSGSIFSDYTDGQKTKEIVYTSDLKVKNTYTAEYKNGEREEITKWDNNNKEIEKYIQIDSL